MLKDNLNSEIITNELNVETEKIKETEEERENRLDREESARKLKAIIFVVIPLLVGFLTFTYFFLNSIEEKSKLLKQEQSNQQLDRQTDQNTPTKTK
jgi:cytoskeletal protein RodZ